MGIQDLEVVTFCPYGDECEEIIDKVVNGQQTGEKQIRRCRLYVKIVGTDAQGNEQDDWACSLAWGPVLAIETLKTSAGLHAAVESLRNENVKTGELLATAIVRGPTFKILEVEP